MELLRHVGLIFLWLNVSKYINSLFSLIFDLIMICLQVVLVILVRLAFLSLPLSVYSAKPYFICVSALLIELWFWAIFTTLFTLFFPLTWMTKATTLGINSKRYLMEKFSELLECSISYDSFHSVLCGVHSFYTLETILSNGFYYNFREVKNYYILFFHNKHHSQPSNYNERSMYNIL